MRVTLYLVLFVTVLFAAAANGAPVRETSIELLETDLKPFEKLSNYEIAKTDADEQKGTANPVDKFFNHLNGRAEQIGEFGRKATAKAQEIYKAVIRVSDRARETVKQVHEAAVKVKTIWQRILDFFRG